MDRKSGAIKKTILRNIEIPPTTEKRSHIVRNYSVPSLGTNTRKTVERDHQILRKSVPTLPITSRLAKENLFEHGLKYKIPQINTTEKLEEKIEKIQNMKTKREVKHADMTPRSKAVANQEITKKLNFPLDQPIFKNLIPINVNDSILAPPEQKKPFRKKYVARTNKDPIPELADFLEPIPPLKHVIPLQDKPLIHLRPNNNFYKSVYELHVNFHPDC